MTPMTPEHPQWEKFINRLTGPEGCNFTQDQTWKCAGGHDKTFAIKIMKSMNNYDP